MATVLITGANRGFGRALFNVYSQRGWTTFPLVRKASAAAQLQDKGGPTCHPIAADVSTQDVGREIARVLEQHAGVLDVLINNAGHIKKRRGLDTSAKDLIDLFNVHCAGVLRCVKGALPFLRQSGRPLIVNISSRWSSISRVVSGQDSQIYSYQIAKCAQNMLTACLDQTLSKDGIRVMAVHPGRLKTALAASDADMEPLEAAQMLADWIEQVDQQTPCGLYDLIGNRYIAW